MGIELVNILLPISMIGSEISGVLLYIGRHWGYPDLSHLVNVHAGMQKEKQTAEKPMFWI
jgi:hypothetical protein